MGSNLYFVSDGLASAMAEYRYDTEDELQKLIADNPSLLLRDGDRDGARLMLVAREYEMAVSEDSTASYYLDHLMVNQAGVPVLVEVTRCVCLMVQNIQNSASRPIKGGSCQRMLRLSMKYI